MSRPISRPISSSTGARSPAAPVSRDDIRRLLDEGFPWMRFPGELELRYQLDMVVQRLKHFRFSGVLALLVFNGFLVVDYLMLSDSFQQAMIVRLLVFTPVALTLFYLYGRWTSRLLRWQMPQLVEGGVLISGVLAAVSTAWVLVSSRAPLSHYYHVGFMVVIMYGNVVQQLRFWMAVTFSLIVLGIHLGCLAWVGGVPPRLMGPIIALVVFTTVFTLMANYRLEHDRRRHYLMTLHERALIDELAQTHERLLDLGRLDALTGLFNRRNLQDYLQKLAVAAGHDPSPLSLVMLDVDHLKKFNDRYGHQAGDVVLGQVATVLSRYLRAPSAVAARHGEDELVAVLPRTGPEEARELAEQIRWAVEAMHIRHEGSSTARVLTVSVSVACSLSGHLTSPDALLLYAEQGLAQVKLEGRNRTRLTTLA